MNLKKATIRQIKAELARRDLEARTVIVECPKCHKNRTYKGCCDICGSKGRISAVLVHGFKIRKKQ